MAGIPSGSTVAAAGNDHGRPAATTAGDAAPAGFAALLDGAGPPAPGAGMPGQDAMDAAGDLAPGAPRPGTGLPEPVEAPTTALEDLPDQLLVLIGVSVPAPAPGTAAVPATGPYGPASGRIAPGAARLPGLAQPLAPVDPGAGLPVSPGSAPLQAAPGTGLEPALDPAVLAVPETASAAADLDLPPAQLPGNPPAVAVRAGPGVLPSALATPLAMPSDPEGGFDDGLAARIGWLAGQSLGRAEIRLNPEQLGVIDIRLDLDGNRVSLDLASANQDVRQALEASLGRLRELLGEQGLELARADVGREQGEAGSGGHAFTGQAADHDADAAGTAAEPPVTVRRRGLLDEYA